MDGLESLFIEINQRNEQLREANRANKEWDIISFLSSYLTIKCTWLYHE